ncbi:MAG TPA: TetR/AcrR family transcriptional regulator [Syntrophomonadaceae bacterium]|nr:TetR/AcrR family transcriptional regulator [Syntrophomonadaceae bacterium]
MNYMNAKRNLTDRDLQALETRRKIYNTAVRLLSEKGYDNTTVDDICNASGVAKGSFYHYFKKKSDIIVQTYVDVDERISQECEALPPDTDVIEKILYAPMFQARYAVEKGLNYTTLIYKQQIDTENAFLASDKRAFISFIRKSIQEGQDKGLIRKDVSADELSKIVVSFSRGITYDWCLNDGNYDLEARMEKAMLMLLQSFLVTEES